MLEDVGESEEYDREAGSPQQAAVLRTIPDESVETKDMYGAPDRIASWVSSQGPHQTDYDQTSVEPLEPDGPPASIVRLPSFSSHQSKDSYWRPFDEPNPAYVEGLLVRLLQSAETVDRDREYIMLLAKRVFHQLDFSRRGFLFHQSVKHRCWAAVETLGVGIDKSALTRLIRNGDKDHNNKIDLQEFITIVEDLVANVNEVRETTFMDNINADNDAGSKRIKRYLTGRFMTRNHGAATAWNWRRVGVRWHFETNDRILFTSSSQPLAPLSAFKNMEIVATRLCLDTLSATFEQWRKRLGGLPEHEIKEYQEPIDAVLDVATQFSVFNREAIKDLDDFDEIAGLVLHKFEDDQYHDCPIMVLRSLKDRCNVLLRTLVGFALVLKELPGAMYEEQPPSLEEWRRLRIKERSELIKGSSAILREAQGIIDQCQKWYQAHSQLADTAIEGFKTAYALHACMEMHKLQTENDIKFVIVGANGLPKKFGFGKSLGVGTDTQC